jgi:TatA/E family protein of Tat protein translocase
MAMNLGPTELLLVLLVLLLLFGAKKLPELARGSGRALRSSKPRPRAYSTRERLPGANSANLATRTVGQRLLLR